MTVLVPPQSLISTLVTSTSAFDPKGLWRRWEGTNGPLRYPDKKPMDPRDWNISQGDEWTNSWFLYFGFSHAFHRLLLCVCYKFESVQGWFPSIATYLTETKNICSQMSFKIATLTERFISVSAIPIKLAHSGWNCWWLFCTLGLNKVSTQANYFNRYS